MKHFLLLILTGVMLCTASCATTKRLARVNSEHVMQRKNTVDGNAINLWPFFIASKDYRSVLYPFIDWDDRGFSVRPIVNKEGDEWSFLFPLFATNPQNGDGWCGIVYWNKPGKYYGAFPLFHYSANKHDVKYIGPIWWETGYRGNTNFGFFPLLWSYDREGMFFPLCYFDERGVYSWIFSMKITDHDFYQWSYNRKLLPDDTYSITIKAGKSLWYYALLWYGGYDHFRTLPPDHPDQILHNWLIEKNLYFKETGKKDFHSNPFYRFFQNRFDKIATTEKERWFGLFPLFHYNTFRDSYKFNLLFGLGAKAVRTPAKDQNSIFLWLFNREHERKRGKFAVDQADTFRHVVGFLWHDQTKTYWQMTPEAAFRFQGIDPDQLSLRTYLALPEDIKKWEEAFGGVQKKLQGKTSWLPRKSYLRPATRTTVVPTPKTAAEAEALLKDLKDPKYYLPVTEKEYHLYPFFSHESREVGTERSTDTSLLMSLLFKNKTAPYEHFFHILGPFGHLRYSNHGEGDYEREKWRYDFMISLLAYKNKADRYVWKDAALEQYGGIEEDALRRRISLTDPKAIKVWEENMESRIRSHTPFSTVKVPKTAAEAQALLDEMNRTENFQLKKRCSRGVLPLFSHLTDYKESQTDILLGALAAFRYSPERNLTHILGPFGYFHRTANHAEHAKYGEEYGDDATCIFFAYKSNHWYRNRLEASEREVKRLQPGLLTKRLRLTGAKEIADWEREYAVEAWLNDPENPAPTPKSVAEAKAALERLETPDQFRDYRKHSWGMFPFLDVESGTDENGVSILLTLLYQNATFHAERHNDTRSRFSIFNRLGYYAEDRSSRTLPDPEKRTTSRSRYVLLTGQEVRTDWELDEASRKNQARFSTYHLRERLLLVDPKAIREWEAAQLLRLWEQDPAVDPVVPKTEEEVRAIHRKNKQAKNYIPITSTRTDVLTHMVFSHTAKSNGDGELDLLSGLLFRYRKEGDTTTFGALGPLWKTEIMQQKGAFPCKDTTWSETDICLIFNAYRKDCFIPCAEHGKKYMPGLEQYQLRDLIDPLAKPKAKERAIRSLRNAHTLADGTLSCAIPENAADAMKFYREYHAAGFVPETKYGFSFFPLIWYDGTESGRKSEWFVPLLLSWHEKDETFSKTRILAGLIYSSKTTDRGVDPLNVRFLRQLPAAWNIRTKGDEEHFLNGDEDIVGYQDESRRILLIAAKHSGKSLFWKDGTPKAAKNLYFLLESEPKFEDPSRFESDWKEIRKCLKAMKLPESRIATWTSRQLLRKEILEQYVESGDFYERGNFGKLLYRYASSRDRAVFWLGGGLLAKYEKLNREENTSVLGWLYRSRITPTEQTRLYFPFVKTHEDPQKESFSFLWRVFHLETDKATGEKSGHILFIPF